MKLAIDMGGTFVDGVIIDRESIVASHKVKATANFKHDFSNIIEALLKKLDSSTDAINEIFIGTTCFTNAIHQGEGLNSIAVIRIGSPNSNLCIPGETLSKDLQKYILANNRFIIIGGKNLDGSNILPIIPEELLSIAKKIKTQSAQSSSNKITAIALSGIASYVDPSQELYAAAILKKELPDISISLSHQLGGGPDLLGRESAAILNAMLTDLADDFFLSIQSTMSQLGFREDVCVGFREYSGGIVNILAAKKVPLLTTGSGPINSILGAVQLANSLPAKKNAIVIDVGGTTTDIDWAVDGQAQAATGNVTIGSTAINLPYSKGVLSARIGGDLEVVFDKNGQLSFGNKVVPWVFGGTERYTLTDAAVAMGIIQFDENQQTPNINKSIAKKVITLFHEIIAETIKARLVNYFRSELKPIKKFTMPIIIVGGGSCLIDTALLLKSVRTACQDNEFYPEDIIIPEHANVANAFGAGDTDIQFVFEKPCMLISSTDQEDKNAKEHLIKLKDEVERAVVEKFRQKGLIATGITIIRLADKRGPYSLGEYKACFDVRANVKLMYSQTLELATTQYESHNDEVKGVESAIKILEKIESEIIDLKKTIGPAIEKTKALVTWSLNEEKLLDAARGAALLGAGGGGPENIAKAVGLAALKSAKKTGNQVKLIDMQDIPDEALIFIYGYLGTPSAAMELLVSKHDGLYVIKKIIDTLIEENLWKNDRPIIFAAGEDGGANAIIHLWLSSQLGVASADLGFMATARPGLQFMSINTEAHRKALPPMRVGLANALGQYAKIECGASNDLAAAGSKAFGKCIELGKCVSLSFYPIEWRLLKTICFPNTFSTAMKLGRSLREHGPDIINLNKVLKTTEYGDLKAIAFGDIITVQALKSPMDTGRIWMNDHNAPNIKLEIIYKNEMLAVIKHNITTNTQTTVVCAPTIISLVDAKTGQVIQIPELLCHDDRRQVMLLSLQAPKRCYESDYMKIMGPKACGLEEIKLPSLFKDSYSVGARQALFKPAATSQDINSGSEEKQQKTRRR